MSAAELFAHAAERFADRTAVEAPDAVLTHRDLWHGAGALARELAGDGIGPGDVVGLSIEKSAAFVLAWLAVCRAGAAPVVLDPSLPEARIATMIALSGARRVLHARDVAPFAARPRPAAGPLVRRGLEDLAYVVFTSGSTGQPKAVLVPERGLASLLTHQARAFELDAASRALFFLSTSFDAMVSDLGTALVSGAALVIATPSALATPARLLELVSRSGITHADLPPALLARMEPAAAPPCLRVVVVGGEASDPNLLRRWAASGRRVVNVYGPTEATVCSSLCTVDATTWDAPLLGDPLPGVEYRIADDEGAVVPAGVPGELFIGGIGVARGYAGDPELTAHRFPIVDGARWFRSGDMVVRRPDGQIVFLGRLDRQLKIAGRRIEPAEIEARLLEVPGVREAAVVARSTNRRRDRASHPRFARERLLAFVAGSAAAPALAQHLAATLPAWMVPAAFVPLASLPRNAHAKIDHAALAALPLPRRLGPARNGHAAVIAAAWEELLGEAPLDDDELFARGGDSLTAIELLALAEARGAALTLEQLQARPTFAALCAASADARSTPATTSAEALRAEVRALAAQFGATAAARPAPPPRIRSLFMTGATGHLGARLLEELLDQDECIIRCLVRARSEPEAERRLDNALAASGLTIDRARARVRAVPGDLALPRFGVDARTWQVLARETDAIVHAGGTVSLTAPYDALRGANVGGTFEILRLSSEGATKHLVYVSSLDVFVAAEPALRAPDETTDLSTAERVHGGYAASKWAAEELVRSAPRTAGSMLIARAGLLTGDARTGKAPARNQLGLFLRGLADLGCAPDDAPELRVDVTPVDFAARALARATLRASAGTWHLASPAPASLPDLVAALREAGAAVEGLPRTAWVRHAGRRVDRSPEAAFAYLSLCRCLAPDAGKRHAALDLFLATGSRLSGPTTRAALSALGLSCPLPTPDLLRSYAVQALTAERSS